MTRFTNVGRKRTYVEASFNYTEDHQPDDATPEQVVLPVEGENPPKKKRKRSKKPKSDQDQETTVENDEADPQTREGPSGPSQIPAKNPKKRKGNSFKDRKLASEQRRLKRTAERNVNTTCFACREKGHGVQDCPKIADGMIKAPDRGLHGKQDVGVVGICYRCGSRRHRLSQCRERVDPVNPLPFASCFVCAGNGHLASSCPQNKSKGIYPNGGCCKLCQETDHLARDCKLRKKDVAANAIFVGIGGITGADEDDFHTFKRRTGEVDKELKDVEKMHKLSSVKVGVHSGKPKSSSNAPTKVKKVVNF